MSSRKLNNAQSQSENRNYFIPREQRMIGFQKFIGRYESKYFFY